MKRITFAFDIASIVASFAAFENKKRTLRDRNVRNPRLAIKTAKLPSQKSNLTAEVDDRHRRAAVADVADHLSSVLRLEVFVPEIIQRDPARG